MASNTLAASSKSSSAVTPKPPLPYVCDACFDIKPHEPPPAYDGGSSYFKPDPNEWNGMPWPRGEGAPSTIVEQCLGHLPRKTKPPSDQAARRLQVTQQIRCGDPCNAQVVRCRVDGKDLVAKIFDPLYIDFYKCEDYDLSPTYFSERFYSCEAAAYMRIKEGGLDGKYTPSFEGCWFLELPLHDAGGRLVARREVRLILQQFVPGDTMQALVERGEADKIPPKVRMELLDRIMEAQSQLDFIGVQSNDLHPRNYIVAKDANDSHGWKITLIDFSQSRVRDLPNSKWRTQPGEDRRLPLSPINILPRCWPPSCGDWIPKEYKGRTKESYERRLKCMKARWEGSNEYAPVNYHWLRMYAPHFES
ncbi:hypothetical protein VSDG_09944 [Cytospora chrysosperma]|uniref:Protein kinase domain-containing protein n=1 Tax=Cytospora chrysosperma TaxID=252740 RepID=A0A423V8P3_CYTCH|nr:hypothetical protein VSDG_09944 [Valsa sordida]